MGDGKWDPSPRPSPLRKGRGGGAGMLHAIEKVNGGADEDEGGAEGGVDDGWFSGGDGGAVADDVVVNGEGKVANGEENENPGNPRIARNFVWPGSGRFFSAQDEYAVRARAVENPAHENQRVGEGVEGAA